jgi:hypothetical protein
MLPGGLVRLRVPRTQQARPYRPGFRRFPLGTLSQSDRPKPLPQGEEIARDKREGLNRATASQRPIGRGCDDVQCGGGLRTKVWLLL